jgi:excinuclease UvrABC nuclease subunit
MIVLDKHIENKLDSLPKGWASFCLFDGEAMLYTGYTANLALRLRTIIAKANEGGIYREMWSLADGLDYEAHSSGLDALIAYKATITDNLPTYQYRIIPWENYVYLGIDAHRFPFTTIVEHTNDDWLYLGPFRSRFFLVDVIDTMSRILKLPYCESCNYPCEKFDKDICRGWCLSLAPEKESKTEQGLEKLDALLKEAYLHPNNGILEMIKKNRDEYFNELEFSKASLLDDEIELLTKYKDWLNFLYTAKKLEYESDKLSISGGMITRFSLKGREYQYPVDSTEFRENEVLALNMDSVDESRIIYEYLKNGER